MGNMERYHSFFDNQTDSRTEFIQITRRSDRHFYPGQNSYPFEEMLRKSELVDLMTHIENVARFWAEVHRAWLGPLVVSDWLEDEEID